MICKKCGSVISDDAKFCNFCGEAQEVGMPVETTQSVIDQQNYVAPDAPVEYQQMPEVEPAPIFEQPAAEEPAPVFEMPVQQEQPLYAEAPTKNNGKGLAIASLVLGILGLVSYLACCCVAPLNGFVSIVPAIVGLILASVAKKKGFTGGMTKAGFILNLIGLILSIVTIIVFVIMFIIALASGGGMEEFFGEFMEAFEEGYNAGYDASAKSYSDSIYSDYYAVKSVISSFLK